MTGGAQDLPCSGMNDLGLVRIEEPPTEKLLRQLSTPVTMPMLRCHGLPKKVIDFEEGALKLGGSNLLNCPTCVCY